MNPVPSPQVIRQGCRELSGASFRTTSTASVATWPGTAPRIVGRSRRSKYDSGMWNSKSSTRSPPATLAISLPTASPTPRNEVTGARSGDRRRFCGSATG